MDCLATALRAPVPAWMCLVLVVITIVITVVRCDTNAMIWVFEKASDPVSTTTVSAATGIPVLSKQTFQFYPVGWNSSSPPSYHKIKYMITKTGLHEVLMHAYNDRRFSKRQLHELQITFGSSLNECIS